MERRWKVFRLESIQNDRTGDEHTRLEDVSGYSFDTEEDAEVYLDETNFVGGRYTIMKAWVK